MSSQSQMDGSEVAILGRILEPERADLGPELARYILALDFRQSDRDRMEELLTKAREGTLSSQEHVEIENYRHVGHLLNLMQSKARISLKKSAS